MHEQCFCSLLLRSFKLQDLKHVLGYPHKEAVLLHMQLPQAALEGQSLHTTASLRRGLGRPSKPRHSHVPKEAVVFFFFFPPVKMVPHSYIFAYCTLKKLACVSHNLGISAPNVKCIKCQLFSPFWAAQAVVCKSLKHTT